MSWRRTAASFAADAAVDSSVQAAALVLHSHPLVLGVTATGALVKGAFESFRERQARRANAVLEAAARAANTTVGEILERLTTAPEREELLVRTLRAAGDAARADKLMALALSLAETALAEDAGELALEAAFVLALDDCDQPHLRLLQSFHRTNNELHLGGGSDEFDNFPDTLNDMQFQIAHPDLSEVLSPLLSVLQRHGLIRAVDSSGGYGSPFGHPAASQTTTWFLTPFGDDFLERLESVREMLRGG